MLTVTLNMYPVFILVMTLYKLFSCICHQTNALMVLNFYNIHCFLVILLILLQAGDIETNPGPENVHDLSILHLNIRSIRSKLDFIIDNFSDFNILCFSETHLDANFPSEMLFLSNSYSVPYRKDRTNHGGGVMAYVNSNLLHVRRPELEIFCEESLWIEVKVKNELYLIGLFYSPSTADTQFFNNLDLNIEKALELSKNLIIVGDLNEDLLNPNFHNLKDVLMINSMTNVITEPTRIHAILDPIIIPDDLPFLDSGSLTVPANISDHKATYISLPFQYDTEGAFNRLIFLYKKANFTLLKQKILNYDWSCLTEGTLDEACSRFNDTFLEFVNSCIPSKNVLIRPNDKPWYDSEIRRVSRKRDRLKRKFNKSGNANTLVRYKFFRNKVNNLKRHAKEQFYNNLEFSISDFHTNDKKQFWKVVRHFVKSNSSSASIPPLNSFPVTGQNEFCFSSDDKAELLNEYFTSISTVNDENVELPDFEYKCQSQLSSIVCTPQEVATLIELLNPNKATGPDGISNKMLKSVANEISVPLSILFNRSFREGKFAEIYKYSNVIPLPKKGDNSDPSTFRPVSLLSNVGKLQERIAFKHIYNFLHENDLLYKYQSGFLPNHSTTFQLIDIYHHICQTFDNNQFSCMVFLDVSKAFDRVWHKGLVFKLRQNGIAGELLEWITDYLNDRKQKVIIRNSSSGLRRVNAGVPQGSVLGPLLFLIYINDISDSLLSLTRLFADDSSLFCAAATLKDIEGIINHDLLMLVNWASQWLIKFNPLKTEVMIFTLKHIESLPNIIFDGTPVKFVTDHKHLGLTFSSNGKWHSHIENIKNSASKVVGIMRKLKYTFSRVALNQIYLSYLLPIIEYSCVVWDGCTIEDINSLQKIQNEAARIVTGLTRSVSLDNLYRECGWVSLLERRRQQKLVLMYKSINGLVPAYISDIIPPLVGEANAYNLRNQANITVPFCRTEISRKSCIPSSISAWNSLDVVIRNSPSLDSFKYQLKRRQNNTKVPLHYRIGNRYLSALHARIRNNCSNLRLDLFINHLSPSFTCSCSDEAEDAAHYLFRCSHFINERVILFQSTRAFHPLNINILLFGDDNLSIEDNTIIFTAVQTFIKDTRRFAN
ncbi:MAG: hypothetical protein JAZ17_27465 [Candidatus Thiodiazotropha endolucinida]|nr:hypothetical protein [Candidatus Thiodiazotropha endolucinida]